MSALCFVAATELATTYSWEFYLPPAPPPQISFKSYKSHDATSELREAFQQLSIRRLIGQWKLGDQLDYLHQARSHGGSSDIMFQVDLKGIYDRFLV